MSSVEQFSIHWYHQQYTSFEIFKICISSVYKTMMKQSSAIHQIPQPHQLSTLQLPHSQQHHDHTNIYKHSQLQCKTRPLIHVFPATFPRPSVVQRHHVSPTDRNVIFLGVSLQSLRVPLFCWSSYSIFRDISNHTPTDHSAQVIHSLQGNRPNFRYI